MKRPIVPFVIFLALAAILSSQNACSGTQQNSLVNTVANAPAKANSSPGVDASVYPPLASGVADADFELIDGTKFKVSDKKGKVVLLTLWGTWCGPCRAEVPTLVALADQYRDKGFEVIGLNVGDGNGTPETNDQINRFIEQMKINYTVARSSSANTRQFYQVTKAEVVPQSLLVDRQGRLRGVFIGGGPRISASIEDNVAKITAE
jgi:thiol-disulfide isomerase/thioredoxin